MAGGQAGAKALPALYRDYEAIPTRGSLAVLTVPGAVGGWIMALQAAKAAGGRLPLDILLAPAIAHARNGYKCAV
jgi:oxamate amidohydrolase